MNNTRVSYLRYLRYLDHSLLLSQRLSAHPTPPYPTPPHPTPPHPTPPYPTPPYPTHAASMLLFNVTTFNSRELPASNFSLQCLCRITPLGHENLGNDRLLTVKLILLNSTLGNL